MTLGLQIITTLERHNNVPIEYLSDVNNVSEEEVIKYVVELEREGVLKRQPDGRVELLGQHSH